jgi:Stage II sporulation protein E (SpoIIE)/FHA domain
MGDLPEEGTVVLRAPLVPQPDAPREPTHSLLLMADGMVRQRFVLPDHPVIVGRTAPADIVLDDTTVSRRHCRLSRADGHVVLEDLGSTNGTRINGAPVKSPTMLEGGDVVGIGGHELHYQRRSTEETEEIDALERDLEDAANYVRSILPPPIDTGPVLADWFYLPSARLGGDVFGYRMLDAEHFASFVVDVAGHGAKAALHAVTVANVLRQGLLPSDFHNPADVLRGLNRMFTMERHGELFFTMWYSVYHLPTRRLAYATGGHHPGFLLSPPAHAPQALGTRNPSIGIAPDRDMASASIIVPPDSTLHLFSDGVFEITDHHGRQWELKDALVLLPDALGHDAPQRLYQAIRAVACPGPLEDDYSSVVLRFS